MDKPIWKCKSCKYSGPEYEKNEENLCECRRDRPTTSGFPIVNVESWCWDGTFAHSEIKKDSEK